MKLQILKLAKRLSRFTFTDIQTMVEIEESETQKILDSLVEENQIKLINEEYFFITNDYSPNTISLDASNNVKFPTPTFNFEDLTNDPNEIKLYKKLSKNVQEKMYKWLFLIKCTNNLGGSALREFLLQFEKKYPNLGMAYTTFHRKKKLYREKGLIALVPLDGSNTGKTIITQEQYDMFKLLYLSPEALTASQCIKRMEAEGVFSDGLVPGAITFERQVRKEFTKSNILHFRTNKNRSTQIIQTLTNASNDKYEDFIDGANAFLESEYLTTLAQQKSIKSGIKNHLIPYFKKFKFKDINEESLRKFKKERMSAGLSPGSISRIIVYLKYIVEGYSKDVNPILSYAKATVASEGLKSKFELINTVNKVKNTELYLPVLLVLSLGLKLGEVEALSWDDIDLLNKEITIDKVFLNGEIVKYRKNHQKRICKIPAFLYKVLKIEKAKAMRMFGEITNTQLQSTTNESDLSFDILRDSYVKDLIDHQIPLNLISKRLGFCHTNEFLEHYDQLIDETLIDNYDPLAI